MYWLFWTAKKIKPPSALWMTSDLRLKVDICALLRCLRSIQWQFLTDVSGKPTGPILKGQEPILFNSNRKGWVVRDEMYKTGLGYISLGREGKVWRTICQIMKPKCDDVLKHTSVATTRETRFLRSDWELGKWDVLTFRRLMSTIVDVPHR